MALTPNDDEKSPWMQVLLDVVRESFRDDPQEAHVPRDPFLWRWVGCDLRGSLSGEAGGSMNPSVPGKARRAGDSPGGNEMGRRSLQMRFRKGVDRVAES